eukprot:9562080-Prorocentrum_lima.AAC.1
MVQKNRESSNEEDKKDVNPDTEHVDMNMINGKVKKPGDNIEKANIEVQEDPVGKGDETTHEAPP